MNPIHVLLGLVFIAGCVYTPVEAEHCEVWSTENFHIITHGIIVTYGRKRLEQCRYKCDEHPDCLGFNYKRHSPDQGKCELLNITREDAIRDGYWAVDNDWMQMQCLVQANMLANAWIRMSHIRGSVAIQLKRNIGISSVVLQKAQQVQDPIQQLFLDKIREYSKMNTSGKVPMSPASEKQLNDSLAKIERQYNPNNMDMTQFPTFNFTDIAIDYPGVKVEVKEDKADIEMEAEVDTGPEKSYVEYPYTLL